MELNAYSQSHFIAAIEGGEIIKMPSISQRNKGTKFRSIKEIYFSYDLNCQNSLPEYPPKVDRLLAMPCGLEKVNTEIKSEYIEEDNELDFGGLTLRQLKNICKSRKTKPSRCVNLKTIKQEDSDLRSEVDEFDLKETLCSWKNKVLKKTKARKNSISKCSSKSSTTSKLCGRSDNNSANLGLLDVTNEICTPLKIKIEDKGYDFSEPQARNFAHEPEILTSESGSAFERSCSDQDLYLTTCAQQGGSLDQFSHEHSEQPVSIKNTICCLNQASYELLDNFDLQNPLKPEDLGIEETAKEENSAVLSEKPLIFSGSDVKREVDMIDHMSCYEPLIVLLEADCSSFQIDHPHYKCPIEPFPEENVYSNKDAPCMALYSDCQDVEFTNSTEVSIDDNKDIEDVRSTKTTNFNSFVKLDNNIQSVDSMPSKVKPTFEVEDKQLLVPDISTEGVPVSPMGHKRKFQDIKCFEIGIDSTSTVAIGRDAKNYIVAGQDDNSLPSIKNVESLHNVTSASEGKRSLVIDTSIAPLTCSPDIQPCIAVDQPIGTTASKGLYESRLEQQPPERLFSTRKTISPNSKEKLHRAMISAQMQDDKQILFSGGLKGTDSREKLFIEKNAADTSLSRSTVKKARIILTSKRLQALRMTQTGPNSRQTLKKGKTDKKLSEIKGTVSDSRVSSSSVQAARTCSTSASCYQNAIAFSQQQMVDIERIATKLLSELQMMKDMVVDTLHPDSRTCSTSRSNADKARVAVENVRKVEDATKRMLSTMTRDCNRFCKIMEISERNDAPPKSNDECIPDSELCQTNLISETKLDEEQVSPVKTSVHKERKIVFADEAGKTLCHVKVL